MTHLALKIEVTNIERIKILGEVCQDLCDLSCWNGSHDWCDLAKATGGG